MRWANKDLAQVEREVQSACRPIANPSDPQRACMRGAALFVSPEYHRLEKLKTESD